MTKHPPLEDTTVCRSADRCHNPIPKHRPTRLRGESSLERGYCYYCVAAGVLANEFAREASSAPSLQISPFTPGRTTSPGKAGERGHGQSLRAEKIAAAATKAKAASRAALRFTPAPASTPTPASAKHLGALPPPKTKADSEVANTTSKATTSATIATRSATDTGQQGETQAAEDKRLPGKRDGVTEPSETLAPPGTAVSEGSREIGFLALKKKIKS